MSNKLLNCPLDDTTAFLKIREPPIMLRQFYTEFERMLWQTSTCRGEIVV